MRIKAVSGVVLTLLFANMATLALNIQPVKAEPVTITLIGPWSGAEKDAFLTVLQAFESQTGINVNYSVLRAEDLAPILPAQFAAGTTPGDLIFMWAWWIGEQAQNGHALEVTDLVDAADFLPGTFDQVNVTGKIYGGTYTGKVKPGFWYRKSFFATNGLTPTNVNSTWAEFSALLADIANVAGVVDPIVSGDGVGWPLSDITEHFLTTFGGAQLQYDLIAGTADWTTDPARGVFEDYLVPTLGNFSLPLTWDSTAINSWWQGDYGLYFMGSWITGMVDNATDLGIIPLPGANALVLPANHFFIPAYTKYPEEAKALFKFLASEEAQSIQVAQDGHIATNIHVPLDAYPPIHKQVAEVVQGKEVLPDLDDTIGGEFQTTFWFQLRLLWATPTELDNVLEAIEAVAPTPGPRTWIVSIHPKVLNLGSKSCWLTAYIEVPEGYNVNDIDVSGIMLNHTLPVSLLDVPAPKPVPTEIGDYDNDGILDLMVKFNKTMVSELILSKGIVRGNVTLTITGEVDGTPFEGTDNIATTCPFGGGWARKK